MEEGLRPWRGGFVLPNWPTVLLHIKTIYPIQLLSSLLSGLYLGGQASCACCKELGTWRLADSAM